MCLEFDKPTEEAINATLMAVVLPCLVVAAVSLLMYIAFWRETCPLWQMPFRCTNYYYYKYH